MDATERNLKIEQYGKDYEALKEKIESLSPDEILFKPAPEKWSAHEMVVHIADAEANSYVRLRRALAEPGQPAMAYDQDKWAGMLDYHSQSLQDHLELFRLLRKASYDLVRT